MSFDLIVSHNHKKILESMIQNDDILDDKEIGNKLSDFEILQVLGGGTFGFVAKVKSKKNLRIYAMKKCDLSLIEDKDLLKYYENESLFMKKLKHPNVCRLYNSFREGNVIYMIMEFMDNGDLFTFINANMKFEIRIPEDKLWNIFEQCLKALVYIHSLGLIHRDIKPANLLLNKDGQIKLSDFNVSALANLEYTSNFTDDIKKKEEILNQYTQVGSGNFQAPEVKNNENESYNLQVDVFSMGVTFCSLAFYQVELPQNPYDNMYSKELVDIIVKMMQGDKNNRPTSFEIYSFFIENYVNKYIHCTGLKSCICCLNLYDSLRDYFLTEVEVIGPLNKISSHFYKIVKVLNGKNDENPYNGQQQGSLNYLIYEFREILYQNGIKDNEIGTNEIEPIYIISFLLKKIHEELNIKKAQCGIAGFSYQRPAYDNNSNRKQKVYENTFIRDIKEVLSSKEGSKSGG